MYFEYLNDLCSIYSAHIAIAVLKLTPSPCVHHCAALGVGVGGARGTAARAPGS